MPSNSLVSVMAAGMAPRIKAQTISAVSSSGGGGWFGIIREAWGGAFQQDVTVDPPREVVAFSAVFSCVTLIASDIAKLGINLMQEDANGISSEVEGNSPFLPVLTTPNRFQTWFKFIEQWIVAKLLHGNAYILKERDQRGVVVALYVLDSQRVTPLVADDGGVYYRLSRDDLSGLREPITIPAREIIHDRMVCLWHPLIGVSPIYACGMSATMGNRIQANSAKFFRNMSRPAGMLSAPGAISAEHAERLKTKFEDNFGGENLGRLFVAGDGLKYEGFGAIPAHDAQLIEQLQWTVTDIARCFHVPTWKIGDKEPLRTSVESLNQTYYSDCLQALIEAAEALLDEGLGLAPSGYHVEFDLDALLRMDTAARYDANGKAVGAGWMKPNEARAKEGLEPVPGGDTCYLQQQYWGLEHLAQRTAAPDGIGIPAAPSAKQAMHSPDEFAAKALQLLRAELRAS